MDTVTTPEVFTRAQDSRFVYAVYRDDHARVFHLDEDTALEHRDHTKSRLRCPVTTCPHPDITTVHRTDQRDGFRHLTTDRSVEHSPESLIHHQGKAAIAQWLGARYGHHLDVVVEAPLPGGERRPDVMATSRQTGAKVVFEVQYTYEPPHVWQARHDWYAEHDIVDVWLFGHTGDHMRKMLNGQVELNPTQRAVHAAGMPVLWFNPFELAVATVVTTQEEPPPHEDREHTVPAGFTGELVVTPLSDARVTKRGLRTAFLDEIEANSRRLAPLWEQHRIAHATPAPPHVESRPAEPAPTVEPPQKESRRARRKRRAQARQALAEAIARSTARDELQQRWREDPIRQRLIDTYGEVPPILHAPHLQDPALLGVAHEHWRAIAIADVLRTRTVGQQVSVADVLAALDAHGLTYAREETATEVDDWLRHLTLREVTTVSEDGQTFTLVGAVPLGRAQPVPTAPSVQRMCESCGLPLDETYDQSGLRYHPVPPCSVNAERRAAARARSTHRTH